VNVLVFQPARCHVTLVCAEESEGRKCLRAETLTTGHDNSQHDGFDCILVVDRTFSRYDLVTPSSSAGFVCTIPEWPIETLGSGECRWLGNGNLGQVTKFATGRLNGRVGV
jgi:hypothetical protein